MCNMVSTRPYSETEMQKLLIYNCFNLSTWIAFRAIERKRARGKANELGHRKWHENFRVNTNGKRLVDECSHNRTKKQTLQLYFLLNERKIHSESHKFGSVCWLHLYVGGTGQMWKAIKGDKWAEPNETEMNGIVCEVNERMRRTEPSQTWIVFSIYLCLNASHLLKCRFAIAIDICTM